MEARSAFQYNPLLNVTAAQIGINKWEWEHIDSTDDEMAKSIMSEKKFDVLPVKDPNGDYKQYFSTRIWNKYDNLNLNDIDNNITLYYATSLRDLIKRFNADSRHFYFLSDYKEIVGLVSYANLTCQPVYNYLYYIISEIETSVSNLLRKRINQDDVIEEFKKKEDDHYKEAIQRFKDDRKEYSFFDYLNFKDLSLVLSKNKDALLGKEKSLMQFQKKFDNLYNDLRVKVMHPVRTLLTTEESVRQIDQLLDDHSFIMDIVNGAQNFIDKARNKSSTTTEEGGEYGG